MRTLHLFFLLSILHLSNLSAQELVDLLNAANQKAQDGKCLEAIHDYNAILQIKPDFSNAFVLKGLCYSMLGNPDSACICFIEGIDRDNEYSRDYYGRYCSEFQPVLNTGSIKTGRFTYLSWIADTLAYVQRDEEFQTEFSGDGSLNSKFKISWDGPTVYFLKLVETNDPELLFLKKNDIRVKILKASDAGFLYYFESNGTKGYGKQQKIRL